MNDVIDLLAIAAHPDDVELSCAGTLLLAKRSGKRVGILDFTRGELSTRGDLGTRQTETDTATKIMALDIRENLGFADGDIPSGREALLTVITQLRRFRPTVVLFPHKEERHPDHYRTSELVHQALFYSGLAKMPTEFNGQAQAPHRPRLALHYMQTYTFEPRIIIDVTAVFAQRMEAMQAYGSQFARPKNVSSGRGRHNETKEAQSSAETFISQAGFYEWIEARARHYGMMIGAEFGEPFWSHEPLGVKDVFQLVTKKVA